SGKDWRAAGFPPFLYITHSTGHLLGVTGGRLVEVTAYPSAVPDDDTYRSDTYWQCPFANAVGLFKTHDDIPARIMEMRRVAFGAPGIVAHESCLKDGERLKIPQFGKLKRDESGAYIAVIDDGFYQHH